MNLQARRPRIPMYSLVPRLYRLGTRLGNHKLKCPPAQNAHLQSVGTYLVAEVVDWAADVGMDQA